MPVHRGAPVLQIDRSIDPALSLVKRDSPYESLCSVGRFRERQYQLAAQKHNEATLKYDYYQQIANYFERECRIARQYDSWNYRGIDPKGELRKAKKAERLLARRNRLRSLLAEEDAAYRKELEERKKLKTRREESSLDDLKERLKERRAEQSLYYPRTCRRYQSYFICPTGSSNPRWDTLRDTNLHYSRVCRDSTNFLHQNVRSSNHRSSKMSDAMNTASREQENWERVSSPEDNENERPYSKYSARYARKSLENTNVRNEDTVYHAPSRMASAASISSGSGEVLHCGDEKISHDAIPSNTEGSKLIERRSSSANDPSMEHERSDESPCPERTSVDATSGNGSSDKVDSSSDKILSKEEQAENRKDTRQFEVEKSMPWLRMDPGDKNLSKQMFLYLTHKELKCKIEDLTKREMHACNKHCWDEALRLRDMKNRLELIREKKLYHMDDLDLDEDARKSGLVNIDKREIELAAREQICMDSTMYSQDAKDMWKKWVHEDEKSGIKDARQQRETLMSSLEKEWQNLAIRDKDRITRSYQTVMSDSDLQEEHKLAAALHAANMKSMSNF